MNKQKLNLLILEDNPDDAELMVRELKKEGFVFKWERVETEKTFRKALAEKPDIILSDYNLPSFYGMAAIKIHQALTPEIPIIIVSDMMSGDLAVECIKAGATDYVHKKQLSRLNPVVKRALSEAEAHSERKKAEEELQRHRDHLQELVEERTSELRKSEEKYRTLTEDVNVGVFRNTVGTKGKFIEVNPAFIKMFGYKSREDVFKLNVSDLYQNPLERKNFNRQILENGFVQDEDLNLIKKDGSALICSVSAVAVKDKNGNVKFYDGIIEDITERKRAEEELRESEERYRTLFESTIDGLFVLDAETKKVVFANQTGAKAYGFDSAEEVVGLNPLDLVHPEDRDRTAGIIEKDMFENNLQQIHEYRTITKDGREAWISAVGVRIEYQKRLAGLVTIRDITEHKKAEQINLRLAEIIRNASDGIILTNPEGQIHYINPAFEKMSGYTQDELLTTDPANLIVTDDITAIAKKIRSAVKTKGEWKGDLFCRRKNGEIYPIDTRVFAIKNIKGELVEIAAIQQDITERKQAEEALRESEEKYRAVLEQSADNIYLIDIETKKILESNSTLRNLLGYSAGEMKKLTVYDFVTHQKDDINEKIEKVINQGRVFIGERKYLRKDGSPVDVEVSSSFITFGNRKALCVVSRDITERKKAEVALHESEERYRAIVEQSNDAIYIYRGDKLLFINDRVCEITGYTREVLYELNMWSLLHPDDRERIMEIGRNRAKGEKVPSIYEAHIVNINGDIRQCEFRVRTISYNGEYAVLGAVRDVTESRKAQDELKKYAETQKALLKEVNHRVKNNLTAILGLLGMEEARTENKDYTDFINKFKGRISGLSAIHSLLSESGWLSLNLGHLCEQVIKASVSCIPDSNLINFNVSPSAILINSNQAHHLTLVINELITNSIKHGQNYKNEIHLDIDLKKDKENVIITYKDTGKGYPQELIDEYFSNIGVGFELIKGIVTHSLRGELQIYNDNGAVTIIIFKPDKETYI